MVWRVQNRGLEGFWTASGAAGRNLNLPEGIGDHLGSILGSSWGCRGGRLGEPGSRFAGVLGARRSSLRRLGDSLEASDAILGRLGASNEGEMTDCILPVVLLFDIEWIWLPQNIDENQWKVEYF